jgi:DNA (cytosine-5)-methyltransferase 3A
MFDIVTDIPQPKDLGIMFKDILISGIADTDKHSCLNTGSGSSGSQEYLKHRNETTGMITLIHKDGIVRTVNQIEMERLQGFPDGYTSILSKAKAGSLLGDGWTLPIIEHIFSFI